MSSDTLASIESLVVLKLPFDLKKFQIHPELSEIQPWWFVQCLFSLISKGPEMG